MTSRMRGFALVVAAALAVPVIANAEEGAAKTSPAVGSLPHGEIGGPGWQDLPKKERVAREWRSLPKAERVAREKRGARPPILDSDGDDSDAK
jgi:hypothetical protein